ESVASDPHAVLVNKIDTKVKNNENTFTECLCFLSVIIFPHFQYSMFIHNEKKQLYLILITITKNRLLSSFLICYFFHNNYIKELIFVKAFCLSIVLSD